MPAVYNRSVSRGSYHGRREATEPILDNKHKKSVTCSQGVCDCVLVWFTSRSFLSLPSSQFRSTTTPCKKSSIRLFGRMIFENEMEVYAYRHALWKRDQGAVLSLVCLHSKNLFFCSLLANGRREQQTGVRSSSLELRARHRGREQLDQKENCKGRDLRCCRPFTPAPSGDIAHCWRQQQGRWVRAMVSIDKKQQHKETPINNEKKKSDAV